MVNDWRVEVPLTMVTVLVVVAEGVEAEAVEEEAGATDPPLRFGPLDNKVTLDVDVFAGSSTISESDTCSSLICDRMASTSGVHSTAALPPDSADDFDLDDFEEEP